MRKLTTAIRNLYTNTIFPSFVPNTEYVTIVEGDAKNIGVKGKENYVPAKHALLSLQCAAKETGYTGKALLFYRNDVMGDPIYNTVIFKDGKPIKFTKTRRCPFDLYGQNTLKKVCKANAR